MDPLLKIVTADEIHILRGGRFRITLVCGEDPRFSRRTIAQTRVARIVCDPSTWCRRPSHRLLDAHLCPVFPGSAQQTLHYTSARRSARSDFRRNPPRFYGEVKWP